MRVPAFAAANGGCPFSLVSVPPGKAVLYFLKAPYGHSAHPVAVDGKLLFYLQHGGFYRLITEPGNHRVQLAAQESFFGTPPSDISLEANKSYFLELTTRFSAKFKSLPERDALKKLKKAHEIFPYAHIHREYPDIDSLDKDPALLSVRAKLNDSLRARLKRS